ncbi:flavodoxin reductase [Thioclava sp. L04-15]|uniref:FAD-binding oxidoreductase n=1 Tax=Thioclava sp. L04-15 TaxID=1915318 RepID=UPI0009974055|nr:FAD-binding oxidoreductase [Thioclava sp. L04-15]OOY26563.1 flavodoxin reductase [Thioclava sp. L04-15]TNE89688.1 MAG: flavodoxin reductase [Paracoccaceae bacterium]
MSTRLTLSSIEPVTRDTYHLSFPRPEGFDFAPGQAVDLTLTRKGWTDESRPFTLTAPAETRTLEFVIKSYPDHEGVTAQIATLSPGEAVEISDPWGAIEDKGPGCFIAGGAGVTPFIAILRARLAREGTLDGCRLIFSNKTEADIILREEFEAMEGLETVWTVTDQDDPGEGVRTAKIDRAFLAPFVETERGKFYICGPDAMVDEIETTLSDLGVEKDRIIREDFD